MRYVRYAIFCDENGIEFPGIDSIVRLDGRYGPTRIAETVRKKRESYKKHFPHKYADFTHYKLVPDLRKFYSRQAHKVNS